VRDALLLLLGLLLTGCHGELAARLNERNITSCVWWSTPLGTRGLTATGHATIESCTHIPCQGR
jgi:hypothetical protein